MILRLSGRLRRYAGFLLRDDLLRHGGMLTASTGAGMVLFSLFHIYMARSLGPQGYGILGALLAIFSVPSQLSNSMQLTLSRDISKARAAQDTARMVALVSGSARVFLVASLALFVVFLLAIPVLARALHISSTVPLVLLALATVFYMLLTVVRGSLQGLQWFRHLAVNRAGERVVLLVVGLALIAMGLRINGAMAALAISALAMLVLGAIPLGGVLLKRTGTINWKEIALPTVPVLTAVLCLAAMSNLDVIVARHFLTPEQAGHYSAVSRVGKFVFFGSVAFSRALFPKASEAQAMGQSPVFLMKRSLLYIGTFCTVTVLAAYLLARPLMSVLFGSEYLDVAYLLPWYMGGVGLLSLFTVMVYYNLSISSNRHLVPLAGVVVLQVALMATLHQSPLQITLAFILSIASYFPMDFAMHFISQRRPAQLRA